MCIRDSFYGVNFDLLDLAGTNLATTPVQGHFGRLDDMAGFADVAAADQLRDSLPNVDAVYVYDDVGHAFMNDSPAPYPSFEARKEALGFVPFDERAATAAWKRLLDFYIATLKRP